ncbi:hypothetical protein DPX16_16348 [Anabarilius grahami]|uniref:Uncharacterized protein n=1 Tax=Anabarilius grahami TaxID=495550 RepID=A0A3N0XK75_ANAGA|nr:hypothetical protein DPX16_16348 [Anabarilius grahami]
MNGQVTVMPPKLGQSEVSDSLTGDQRLIRTIKPPQDVQMAPAESRERDRKREYGGLGSKQKETCLAHPDQPQGDKHIWPEMNKEGRKALGHQQDASSIFTREAFILQMTPKNMYTTPWSARGKDRERGLMLGVRWSDGCCVPMHLAWVSVAVIEPPNIQASTLL